MAKNYKFSGKRINLAGISGAVAAGALCRRAGFVGIPMTHAANGASVSFSLEGVWGMTYANYVDVQPSAGSILFWDTSAGGLSIGSANDDYAAVKCVTAVSSVNGSFDGLLLPQGRAVGQDQS